MAKTKKSKTNVQRHKIIKRMQNELEEQVRSNYGYYEDDEYDEELENEIIKEMLIIIFFRILKLNILAYDTIYFIYLQIMGIDEKYRVYQLLKIYLHLQMQKLFYDGIISEQQLESIYSKKEKILISFEDGAYTVNFGYEFYNNNANEELLDEDVIWALCAVADNVETNEYCMYAWYDDISNIDQETLIEETKNLIVRLKIRKLRRNKIITEEDETMFMSKIRECKLTYAFFSEEEIKKWKSKAYHKLIGG